MYSLGVIYVGDVSFMIAETTFTSIPDSPKKKDNWGLDHCMIRNVLI